MADRLKAGTATTVITPALGTVMAGSFRPRYAEDVDDELFARALVLECDGVRLALVTCDLIAAPGSMVDAVKARVEERCGIPPAFVMVNATHTHTGPAVADLLGVPEAREYTAWAPERIADAVEMAVRHLQPAKIGFGSAEEHGISFCRRWRMKDGTVQMNPGKSPDLVEPVSEIDPVIRMMFVESEGGEPVAAIANFALHYIGTDNGNAISADYFGHFSRQISQSLGSGCMGMLWNGCSGEINNLDFGGKTSRETGHKQAARIAAVLVGHVLSAREDADLTDGITLGAAAEPFTFERKRITEEDLETATRILAGNLEYEEGPFSWVVGQPIHKDRVDVYSEQCRYLAELPERMETMVQAIRIGDAGIVGLPGEVFADTGRRATAALQAEPLFTVSLANDYIGYICTDTALTEEGGYETWAANSSLGGVGTEPAMLEAMEAAWESIVEKK